MTGRTFDVDANSQGVSVYVYEDGESEDGASDNGSWLTWAEVLGKMGFELEPEDEVLTPHD